MNIRELLNWTTPYHTINREERNLAAIFYHTLLINNNIDRFLNALSYTSPIKPDEFAIYFEYSFLRDLWHTIDRQSHNIDTANHTKRDIILQNLQAGNTAELGHMTILEFNSYFGAVPKASKTYIQSPGTWSMARYSEQLANHEEFLKVCKLKWAFNAKPDIVIHTSNDHAICIEAKFESREGQYPTNPDEIKVFTERALDRVNQTSIQQYIMNDLLGIQTQFLLLVQQKPTASTTHLIRTWREAFAALDLQGLPHFIEQWIDRL